MAYDVLTLVFFLIVIVAASEIFTNAIEALGARLNFSEGVTGSIFAAVGTALPETMVPIVAIFGGGSGRAAEHISEEVGVGAILGAPFMLSTLAMFLIGLASMRYGGRRKIKEVTPEPGGFRRDMEFFIFCFTLAFLVAFTPHGYRGVRIFVAITLVLTYFYYVMETVKASETLVKGGHATEKTKGLYLSRIFKEHMFFVVLQLLFAVAMIIAGAKGFVGGVNGLSEALGLPIIAVSLLIVPVATELPEKINSILWIKSGKDTMAVGNITGAMVFQGSLLPAIGIFLTPWTINLTVMSSAIITIIAAVWLYYFAIKARSFSFRHMLFNGFLYLTFVFTALFIAFKH
ncbi:MAG: sodium:calcium antiporter [Deltaproteobacteria bacterium]|nr:sodium:calcium antiporter [Deltaproteobacteria bacterium]